MQKLYWRSARISRVMYVLASLIAVGVLAATETFKETIVQPHPEQKLEAARLMQRAMEAIQNHRVRKVGPIDLEADPTNSGMLGLSSSVTTTNTGSLEAKRTTLNPNWAAVVVELLSEAGVERGGTIAVGVSGSFPALNLAVFSAAEVLDLDAIAIASVGASSWGANLPTLTWLDMERVLADAGILRTRSIAASLGGTRDRAIGMPKLGRKRLREITRQTIDGYCAQLRQEGAGVPTVNRTLGLLQGVFHRAVEWRRLDWNPVVGTRRLATAVPRRSTRAHPRPSRQSARNSTGRTPRSSAYWPTRDFDPARPTRSSRSA